MISQAARKLNHALDSLAIRELEVDTIIYQTALQPYENAKIETGSILADPAIAEKRASLNILSNELYTFLRTIRYDLAKIYWLECGSAFGEDRPGNWLSEKEAAASPYGQRECVETRSTINFMAADSTTGNK